MNDGRTLAWHTFGIKLFAVALALGALFAVFAPLAFMRWLGAAALVGSLLGLALSLAGLRLESSWNRRRLPYAARPRARRRKLRAGAASRPAAIDAGPANAVFGECFHSPPSAMSRVPVEVRHNEPAQRFEAIVDGALARADYRRHGGVLRMVHTEVPAHLEGRGIAAALVKAAFEHARTHGLRIEPACSYVASYMRRHPDTLDLLADGAILR